VSDSPQTRQGVTLVLGTGLIKCAASIGLMQVFEREQIPIREIIASSAGAIFGGAMGLGRPLDEVESFVAKITTFYQNVRLQGRSRLKILMPRLFGFDEKFGLADPSNFIGLFKEEFGESTFDDTTIPLSITATNLANGKRVVVNRGLLWEAICATCSPLGLLPPLLVGGQMLIDGAASEPLPLNTATDRQAQIIVALAFENPDIDTIRSLPNYTHQVRNIFVNQLLNAQIALCNLSYQGEIISVIPKFGAVIEQTDVEAFPTVIQRGAEATEVIVPYVKSLLSQS
jgi:NTE family protein